MSEDFLNIKRRVEQQKAKESFQESSKLERIALQNSIKDSFEKFIDADIDPLIDNHILSGQTVIIRVFDHRPKSEDRGGVGTLAINLNGLTNHDMYYRTFSIAKVLNAGPESAYEQGDIVKLRDFETATIDNPRYEAWTNNPHNSSNMTKVGQEPPSTINNLMSIYKTKMFVMNPLKLELDDDDFITFKVFDANIDNPIKDPMRFIECL